MAGWVTESKPSGEQRPARTVTFLRVVAVLVALNTTVGGTLMILHLGIPGLRLGELVEALGSASYYGNFALCGATCLGLVLRHGYRNTWWWVLCWVTLGLWLGFHYYEVAMTRE